MADKTGHTGAERNLVLRHNPSHSDRGEVTFGPAGRVGVTVLLFVPVAFGAYFSLYFYAAAVVWMLALPLALHQVWQPARVDNDAAWPGLRARAPEPVHASTALEPARSGDSSAR